MRGTRFSFLHVARETRERSEGRGARADGKLTLLEAQERVAPMRAGGTRSRASLGAKRSRAPNQRSRPRSFVERDACRSTPGRTGALGSDVRERGRRIQ
jgi:hypothetical protein